MKSIKIKHGMLCCRHCALLVNRQQSWLNGYRRQTGECVAYDTAVMADKKACDGFVWTGVLVVWEERER